MVSVTWTAIGITLALLFLWMGVIYLSKRTQMKSVEAIVAEEMTKRNLNLSKKEVQHASKQVYQNATPVADGTELKDILMNTLKSSSVAGEKADHQEAYQEAYQEALRTAQYRVNQKTKASAGKLWKGSRTAGLAVFFTVLACLGLGLYFLIGTDRGYYAYFPGAVAVIACLFLFNIYNTYFFIPLLIGLLLAGLFIGLGAREVVLWSTLNSGGERPT